MINQEEIKSLNGIKSDEYKFVSLYLNIDQKLNSIEKIKIKLKNLITKAEKEILPEFVDRIETQVQKSINERFKGIVFFIGKNEEDFKYYEFKKPLASAVFIESNLHLTPLEKLLDEYERYGVLVLDKEKSKFFTVYLGEIEEIKQIDDYYPGKHSQGGWSQRRFEGHIENHLLEHLKKSSGILYNIWKDKKLDRIILGGTDEITAKLEKGLADELNQRIVGKFNTELFQPIENFLQQSLEIEEKAERTKEMEMMKELENNLGDGNKAVSGIIDVLSSLNDKKVMKLLIQENYHQAGYYCQECDMLILDDGDCSCEGEKEKVDLVDEMVQKALAQGAEIEFIQGEEKMGDLGNIGAMLRY